MSWRYSKMYLDKLKSALGFQLAGVTCCVPLAFEAEVVNSTGIVIPSIRNQIRRIHIKIMSVKGRENYLRNDDFFMASAVLVAKRSPDPNTQVGACIVKNERVISSGFNHFPNNCADNFSWARASVNPLDNKYMYVVHAEPDAILGASMKDIQDSRLFVTLFPCNECAKLIIQAGIKEVTYLSDIYGKTNETIASKRMLTAANIKYSQFVPTEDSANINLFLNSTV